MLAPEFWLRRNWREKLIDSALVPVGWIYSATVARNARKAKPVRAPVPVICVGNLSAGGVGKTPVSEMLARRLQAMGKSPAFLSRGYGGKLPGPIMVSPRHRAVDVGDEPLLLARTAPVVVSRKRPAGAALAVHLGADVIVMDDGFQNFSLAKDLSVIVVDAATGFGNGRVLPAGPLRERVPQGLKRADAVVLVGEGEVDLPGFDGPVFRAQIGAVPRPDLKGEKVVAFAGIGRPEKFFASLEEVGAEITLAKRFGDHHVYASSEIAFLRAAAKTRGARLITTAKDFVRMTEFGRAGIDVLAVEAVFENTDGPDALLQRLWPVETSEG